MRNSPITDNSDREKWKSLSLCDHHTYSHTHIYIFWSSHRVHRERENESGNGDKNVCVWACVFAYMSQFKHKHGNIHTLTAFHPVTLCDVRTPARSRSLAHLCSHYYEWSKNEICRTNQRRKRVGDRMREGERERVKKGAAAQTTLTYTCGHISHDIVYALAVWPSDVISPPLVPSSHAHSAFYSARFEWGFLQGGQE